MQRASAGRSWHLAIPLALVSSGILATLAQTPAPAPRTAPSPRPAQGPVNSYVDPALCAQCHTQIADNFRKTGMGRSFYRLRPGNTVEDFTPGKPFYHQASDSYFAMIERGGKYYQRRWQIGYDGKEANVEEKQVDFVMGSGNHGRSYFHLTSRNTLQELPLGWYTENGGSWGMGPGFDRAEFPGSTRLVGYECMFCHNAYPKIPKGHEEWGAEAVYLLPLPEGIDCQRCHGPGERHVEAVKAGVKPEEIRRAIVNPRRLSPEREMEVCMQCHLETSSEALPHAIQRFDRGPFSYVPGQALGEFRLSFDRAPGKNDGFEIAHAAYRLRESQCFLKSAGKLRCTTCHDPHNIPRGDAATAHTNGICRDCHGALERLAASSSHQAGANCVGCHMPKRRTDDAVHIVMTDHFIQRRKPVGDLLAEKAERPESPATAYRGEVVPYYPAQLTATRENSLYAALAQVRDGSNLKDGLPLLAGLLEKYRPPEAGFYAGMADGYRSGGDRAKAVLYLEEAVRRAPASEIVLLRLGDALMESRQWAKAEAAVRRATVLAPDDAVAQGLLGQILQQEGRNTEARLAFEKGIKLDPELPELHQYLGALLVSIGDRGNAEREFRAALRIEPGIAEWQSNLAGLLASRGDLSEARYLFERSIRFKPDYAGARLNYARLLANTNQVTEAEKQAKAAVEADAGLAAAHELWGYLLAAKGDADAEMRELQMAVRLQPDLWRAQYQLGAVLAQRGDTTSAAEHLRIAAKAPDAEVKAAAEQMLQRLGRM
jgi:predicted CXXCH cytochrome family protein